MQWRAGSALDSCPTETTTGTTVPLTPGGVVHRTSASETRRASLHSRPSTDIARSPAAAVEPIAAAVEAKQEDRIPELTDLVEVPKEQVMKFAAEAGMLNESLQERMERHETENTEMQQRQVKLARGKWK